MNQDQLAYVNTIHCDCKFMNDSDSDDSICKMSEQGFGCPEIYAIISALTPVELAKINKRAHLDIKPSGKKRKGCKPKIDYEIRKMIDRLPDEASFALINAFNTAVKNVSKQLEKCDNPNSTTDRY